MSIPKRVKERINKNLRQFQGILLQQKARDISEADTVTLVKDILNEVFGYDKYSQLTSEHSIRGTYCDLAVQIESKIAFLIEVKAVDMELKENHIKQAVDYAANQGCEWVVLTNGIEWRLYQVIFKKPIDKHEVTRINMLDVNPRNSDDLEKLYVLTREGLPKSAMSEYRDRKDATSRFMVAAILLHDESIKSAVRREIRRITDIFVEPELIDKMLRNEVLKRETIEGEQAESATRRVLRGAEKRMRTRHKINVNNNADDQINTENPMVRDTDANENP